MALIKSYKYSGILLFFMQSIAFANAPTSTGEPAWQGLYIGALSGLALTNFNAKTGTQAGSLLDATQATIVNQAGNQHLKPDGFLAGITAGYNWQLQHFLFGLEGDLQSLSVNDTTNSGAILYSTLPSYQFVITSYAAENWLMTARPRIGWITDSGLFYLTGGWAAAWLQSDFIFTNNARAFESQRVRQFKSGYAAGAGFETGLTNHISMKIEYLLARFGRTTASKMNQSIPPNQTFTNSVNLNENIIRLGLNYHFDNTSLSPQLIPLLFNTDQWHIELGLRPFYSTGIDGSPQPLLGNPGNLLISRLTFKDLTATTLEAYFRVDHNTGLFAKGLLGAGTVNNAKLIDEDFPSGGAYSHTLSKGNGNLSFATVDVGYSFFKIPTANTGMFIGYNYYAQNLNVYGCQQLAGAAICVPATELSQFLGISEDDNYKSARIGIVSQFDITDRVNLTSEVAFLPLMRYRGQDNHNARQLIGPEQSNFGNGSMLESVLSYQFSDSWNVGLGARYWMWNMHNGNVLFEFLGEQGTSSQPARYHTYRYGAFLQLNYSDKPIRHFSFITPATWQGFYFGGHLGGGWGNTNWSDPFGSTPGDAGFTNVAGFEDNVHATGPLADIDAHYYWQKGSLIWGVGGYLGLADVRGENTLFSGLGGVNGETYSRYFMALVGKLGTAYEQSLFYFNVGPAFLNTKYHINANTDVLSYGAQSQSVFQSGITLGAGIDYAISDHWTTNVEYDYIRIPHKSLAFSDIDVINTKNYSINQTMNIFKVGISYRL